MERRGVGLGWLILSSFLRMLFVEVSTALMARPRFLTLSLIGLQSPHINSTRSPRLVNTSSCLAVSLRQEEWYQREQRKHSIQSFLHFTEHKGQISLALSSVRKAISYEGGTR